jgi:hypothetical protein
VQKDDGAEKLIVMAIASASVYRGDVRRRWIGAEKTPTGRWNSNGVWTVTSEHCKVLRGCSYGPACRDEITM